MISSGFVFYSVVAHPRCHHFPLAAYKNPSFRVFSYLPSSRRRSRTGFKLVGATETVKQAKWPKDERGNIIWTLRRATRNDVHFIVSHSEVLTPSLVESLIENSLESCLVAQIGEDVVGYSLFAIERVPVDLKKGFESPLQTNGLYVASFRLPNVPSEMENKLVLGSLKMLKQKGCLVVSADVAVEDTEKAFLLEKCGFERGNTVEKEGSDFIEFRMNLVACNVDPQKKIV
ncbi:hypothetical protein Gasu2_60860 [Galdieria sulphuraria]|uniref:N-acetyltransferase domain-containing protein n=1 Tax=Galdieria sulphuraria TaxID=130081 RepID=M2XIK6_GALSU|nr:uncharacterized protein Gasu_27080 [Galdieria sulphuraria]EME29922.1 hypothetical protein Gasu_27080 [Galdieria sulphuraria]GJD11971.1 hypothetical protein Gasu2_60860 [Galdieria sulphuraria]|eukprot:XP_005706442.1 hypothetical protein Gasu_27080 [Galdieria sulphuraria]